MLCCVRRYDSLGLWGVYKEVRSIPEIFEDPGCKAGKPLGVEGICAVLSKHLHDHGWGQGTAFLTLCSRPDKQAGGARRLWRRLMT